MECHSGILLHTWKHLHAHKGGGGGKRHQFHQFASLAWSEPPEPVFEGLGDAAVGEENTGIGIAALAYRTG